jgi:tRNA (uracil-5-)-methyltransferase TRM9
MSRINGSPEDTVTNVVETYDCIASDFDRTRNRNWPQTQDFVNELKAQGPVLDLGCGNGKDTVLLLGSGFNVISVDLSTNQCRTTYKNASTVEAKDNTFIVVQADCLDLPFRDEIFGGAIFMATLHHLPNIQMRVTALEELKRVLMKGGQALISVWDYAQPRFRSQFEGQIYDDPGTDEFGDVYVPWKRSDGQVFDRYYHLFIQEEFVGLLETAGFGDITVFTEDGNHFARIMR